MFFDNNDNFFDNLFNTFNRPVKDVQPFRMYAVDGHGYIVIVNTLGIDKDKLRVSLKTNTGRGYPTLTVQGETKIEKINFENKVNLSVILKIPEKIESISYDSKNGLTSIYLKTSSSEEKIMKAQSIEDGSINW